MSKQLTHDLEVAATADTLWAVYGDPDLPDLLIKLIPSIFHKIDRIEGDGGLGTILHVFFPPGSIPQHYKEKLITVDEEKRLIEVIQIEGGNLELGCTFYQDSIHIVENGCDSCIIKSKSTYELKEGVEDKITINMLTRMAEELSKYVLDKQAAATATAP